MIKKQITYFLLLIIAFIVISCEKEVFTGTEAEEPVKNAKLFIRSNPSGALIYYNDKYMGINTPDTLTWLSSGAHSIVLKKELFLDETVTATLIDQKTTEVFIDYSKNPKQYGDISCLSFISGVSIFINGINTGYTTPHTFTKMFPGVYAIKYYKLNYRADSTIITVEAGTTKNTNFSLQDTSRWVDYSRSNSKLLTDDCYSIIFNKNNVKWIGSSRGVNSFDGKNWKSFDITNSIVQGPIVKLAIDKNSNIWAASSNGLFMFNGTTWINQTSNLGSANVTGVTCDSKGIIWVSTNAGVAKFDGTLWNLFRVSNSGLVDDLVNSVTAGQNGKIWCGTLRGISAFDGQNWNTYNVSSMGVNASIGNNIRDIGVDVTGIVWVAHSQMVGIRGGLTKYDGTKWSEVVLPIMPNNEIASINIDSNNRKWISTANGLGMFVQPLDTKLFIKLDTSIPAKSIFSSCVDNNGDVWFATMGNGIAKIKKGNY